MNLEELKAKWRENIARLEKNSSNPYIDGMQEGLESALLALDALEPSDAELVIWGLDKGFLGTDSVSVDFSLTRFDFDDRWLLTDPMPSEARAILLEAWRKEQGDAN